VAILWAMRKSPGLTAAVIQSPLLEAGFPVPVMKVVMARLMAVCWPTRPFRLNLDVAALSHDPEVVAAYRADPLVHGLMTARVYQSIVRAKNDAIAHAPTICAPTLLLCGAEDRITSLAHASRWFERLTCEKRRIIFPGCAHELHHETVRDDVLRLATEWTVSYA